MFSRERHDRLERLFLDLNELVSDRLCHKLGSAAVSQELLFKYFINLVRKLNGNLYVDVLFAHVYPLSVTRPQIL